MCTCSFNSFICSYLCHWWIQSQAQLETQAQILKHNLRLWSSLTRTGERKITMFFLSEKVLVALLMKNSPPPPPPPPPTQITLADSVVTPNIFFFVTPLDSNLKTMLWETFTVQQSTDYFFCNTFSPWLENHAVRDVHGSTVNRLLFL